MFPKTGSKRNEEKRHNEYKEHNENIEHLSPSKFWSRCRCESTAILSSRILLRCSGIDELNGSSTVFACCAISFTKCLLYVAHHSDNNIPPFFSFRMIAKIRVLEVGPSINDVTHFSSFLDSPSVTDCHKNVSPPSKWRYKLLYYLKIYRLKLIKEKSIIFWIFLVLLNLNSKSNSKFFIVDKKIRNRQKHFFRSGSFFVFPRRR